MLQEQGKLERAEAAYHKAISLQPAHADAYNNLGTVLDEEGRLDEAIAAFEKAIALKPDHADAYFNVGNVFKEQDRLEDTIRAFLKTVSLRRYPARAYRDLGDGLYREGRLADAATVYETWLRHEPNHPVATHLLAACSGRNVPERASNQYVEGLFGRYAADFDAHMQRLDYRAPQIVAAAVAAHGGAAAAPCDVLDAGCGTGLCGPLLRRHARRLVGVDLSRAMLKRARALAVYDDLVRAELVEYMRRCSATYDLIVSADVLVYFGELRPVFLAAAAALRPRGRLIFTVEQAPASDLEPGYRIHPHGRYSHSESYVLHALVAAKLQVCSITVATLRMQGAAPVAGLVTVAER